MSSRTRNNDIYTAQHHSSVIPNGCIEAEVQVLSQGKIRLIGTIVPLAIPPTVTTFHNDRLLTNIPDLHRIIHFSSFPVDTSLLARVIQQGTAVGVTDASIYSDTIGAASWVIQCSRTGVRCEGRVQVPPSIAKMNSYRAEIFEIYAILIVLRQLSEQYNITNGTVAIACDNDNGLAHSLVFERRIPIRFKSSDILWAIHDLSGKLPIQIIPRKVTGHTDRLGRKKTLLKILNIEMDTKAKSFCRYIADHSLSLLHHFLTLRTALYELMETKLQKTSTNLWPHIYINKPYFLI